MSVGISIIWITTGVLNWAHGALVTLGGYVTLYFYASQMLGFNFIAAFLLNIIFLFFVGILLELAIFRTMRGQPEWDLRSVFATLGIGMAIPSLLVYLFNPRAKGIPPIVSGSIRLIGDFVIDWQKSIILVVAVSSLMFLSVFLKKSKLGMAMTAMSQDMTGAQIVGINVNVVFAYALGIGIAMAGITGALLGSIYYVSPVLGDEPLFKGFIVLVLGGMGSVKGAFYASFILGITEALIQQYVGSFWVLPVLFIFMIGVLILRPHGIAGTKEAVK